MWVVITQFKIMCKTWIVGCSRGLLQCKLWAALWIHIQKDVNLCVLGHLYLQVWWLFIHSQERKKGVGRTTMSLKIRFYWASQLFILNSKCFVWYGTAKSWHETTTLKKKFSLNTATSLVNKFIFSIISTK